MLVAVSKAAKSLVQEVLPLPLPLPLPILLLYCAAPDATEVVATFAAKRFMASVHSHFTVTLSSTTMSPKAWLKSRSISASVKHFRAICALSNLLDCQTPPAAGPPPPRPSFFDPEDEARLTLTVPPKSSLSLLRLTSS